MPKVVIHNHLARDRRLVGSFRAVAGVKDDCGCGCGGKGNCGHNHDAPRDDAGGYRKADLSIDVLYRKGPMGNYQEERRHYTIPNFLVNPRGGAPDPAAVATALRRLPEHITMHKDGWRAEKAEGYFKRENRDFGRKL